MQEKPIIFCTKERRMAGTDNLHTKASASSYKTEYERDALQVHVLFEKIKHLRLCGVSVFMCVCVCVCVCVCMYVCMLVGGCVLSLAGLLVCVLVLSGGTKIRYFFVSPCDTHEAEA